MNHRWLALAVIPMIMGASWLMARNHTYVVAIQPSLEAVDEDHDGRVVSAELARSSPTLISFHKIDHDGDGVLTETELLTHLIAEDPGRFDHEPEQLEPAPSDHVRYSADAKPVRVLRVLFEFMLAEVLSVDKRIPLSSDEQLRTASLTGRLDSDASIQVAANLVAAYQACGLQVPPMLTGVDPVLAEPGLRPPPFAEGPARAGRRRLQPPPFDDGQGERPPPKGKRGAPPSARTSP